MRGGSSNTVANINPKDYGFTGYQYAYKPCDHLIGEWGDEAQQAKYIECLKRKPTWDNLDSNAKNVEIQRQWHALPEISRNCLMNASPNERDFIHKFVNLNSEHRVDTWVKLSPEKKEFLIGILEEAKTKTELRKNELIRGWQTNPRTYPNYDREKRIAGYSCSAAKRDYDNALQQYNLAIEFYNAARVAHFNEQKSKVGKIFDFLRIRGTSYSTHSINDEQYNEAVERSKTIMDAAKQKWEELQEKCDTFDDTYQLPDESAVDDTLRSTINSEAYIEKAISEINFLLETTLGEEYLNKPSLWLAKSPEQKMQIINSDYYSKKGV